MEYVQEAVTTLHDLEGAAPDASTERAAVVVPMTEREHAGLAAEHVLSSLEAVDPGRVVVPLRAGADRVGDVADWLEGFDLSLDVLWCDGPRVESLLEEHGLDGTRGKGRDVWLALGVAAADAESVVVHDADARSYDERVVPRLLFPLAEGRSFSKGYYARVENDRLYGRLFRLLYRPLLEALSRGHDAPILEYLEAFRYALAGELAVDADLARELRIQRGWGLEVGTLGEAFRLVGPAGSAQVDLGVHEHDHRSVSGPDGLSEMADQVAGTLLGVVEDAGVAPDYDALVDGYRTEAERLVEAYAADAAFNDLAYDRADELRQVDAYADAVGPPGRDRRLPAWRETTLGPDEVAAAAARDLERASTDATPDATLDGRGSST